MKNTNTQITITRTGKTANATFLPYAAYKRAHELASEMGGKIGKTTEGYFKATFNSVETAEKFVKTWRAEYNDNRVVVEPTKPKVAKGKATKTTDNFVVVKVDGKEFLVDASALVPTKATPSSSKKTTPKATPKKSTTSSKKATPSKSKGKAFDFSKIKGKDNQAKNKALHATLVSMGLRDSNAPEYKTIWNARPWAN